VWGPRARPGSGPAAAAPSLATEAGSHQVPRPRGRPPILGSCSRGFPPPVRSQADPGRADWPTGPASRPLRPYPGAVTPPRGGQARILRGRWVPLAGLLRLCWPGLLDSRSAAFAHDPAAASEPPETPVAGGVWAVNGGEQRRGVASPSLAGAGRAGPISEQSVHPKVGSSAELPGRLPVPRSGQDPQTRPSRGEGARVEDDGPAGNRPRATPLRVAPGTAPGPRRVCSPAAQSDRGSAGPWSRNGPLAMPFLRLVASRDSSPEPRRCRFAGAVHRHAYALSAFASGAGPNHEDGGPAPGPPYRRRGPGKAQPFARRRESRSRCPQVGAGTSATPGLMLRSLNAVGEDAAPVAW
jgi:hypothetical protein